MRPISWVEQAFGWQDALNLLLLIVYPYVHFKIDLNNLFTNANSIWLWVIPSVFLLIAGLKLQFRVNSYEKQSIELIYDEEACQREEWGYTPQDDPVFQATYMVGTRPTGKITLNDVEVYLTKIEPISTDSDFIQFTPALLNPLDSKGQTPSKFSVNPGKTATSFVEVFSWDSMNPNEIGIHFYANYHDGARKIPSSFPRGNYKLTLRAMGRNIPAYEKVFEIQMDTNDISKPRFGSVSN